MRELVGHGECLMGILDSYPHPYPLLPPEACEGLERAAVSWRWRLREMTHRLSRVHGDFHPWNLLFRGGTDFSVLDRSRGEWGEPADDLAALAVNYLFFGLLKGPGVAEPFRGFFHRFFDTYLSASGDKEVFDTLPPFFGFRALVLAHPRWYPKIPEAVRRRLLRFAGSTPGSSKGGTLRIEDPPGTPLPHVRASWDTPVPAMVSVTYRFKRSKFWYERCKGTGIKIRPS